MPNFELIASSNGINYVKVGKQGHVFFNSPKEESSFYYVPTEFFKIIKGKKGAIRGAILFLAIVDRSIERTRSLKLRNFGISGFKPLIHRTEPNSLPIK